MPESRRIYVLAQHLWRFATIVVLMQPGTPAAGADLVAGPALLLSSNLAMTLPKVTTLDEIVRLRARCRRDGRKIVFTNGCFDLLHVGHVRYLNQARSFGDLLIVGVNSDSSVRALKGNGRPVVTQSERAEVLAALACVDHVFIFDDPTPQQVIDLIVPDVLVKGADWNIDQIVGRETVENAGGTVLNVPLAEGASTSGLISRVLESFGSKPKSHPNDGS